MGSEVREDLQDRAAEHERAQRVRDLLARMTQDYRGKQIGGRYVLEECIGAGGMGFIVTEALANTRTGAGILAGIGIALLAMMIDRVVQKANTVKH